MNSYVSVVSGYGIGKTLIIDDLILKPSLKIVVNPNKELMILDQALKTFRKELEAKLHDPSSHDVLAFQYAMSLDQEFIDSIKHYIITKKMNAGYALRIALDYYVSVLSTSKNDYIRDRIDDFESFYERMMYVIQGIPFIDITHIQDDVIVILKTLNLHVLNQLNPMYVKGIIAGAQSVTSHAAIIAKQKGIPTLFGVDQLDTFENNEPLLLDAIENLILKNPTTATLSKYQEKTSHLKDDQIHLLSYKNKSTVTNDGHVIPLLGNMSSLDDLSLMASCGVEGIGLIRTELLFIDKLLPPKLNEQVQLYSTIIQAITPKIITFRLFDLGGDKHVPFIHLKKEENPLLGLRGIRLFNAYKDLFYTQIKAMLMASIHGDIHLLIPMVSTKKEVVEVIQLINDVKSELLQHNIPYGNMNIGVMIEVPSLALTAHMIAPLVDFFSIGTNDLIQYTMATDRSLTIDEKIADPYHPSIIALLSHVIESANKNNIPVSVCGDVASEPLYASLLIALGVSTLSMVPHKILLIRKHIHDLNFSYINNLKEELLLLENRNDVQALLTKTPSN
ncbi:MAG: phosphoenolpyruvate--protein phosphotransferase [Firmicutes bacterium]|nr:phosphoenolpyruvate--protein phosphotransferase [Bacillota bacterium]